MNSDADRRLWRLIERYNIHFDTLSEAEWPEKHRTMFSSIVTLGQMVCDDYVHVPTIESEETPWQSRTKCRAKRIAALANLCLRAGKNEESWRMSLELEILSRFSI